MKELEKIKKQQKHKKNKNKTNRKQKKTLFLKKKKTLKVALRPSRLRLGCAGPCEPCLARPVRHTQPVARWAKPRADTTRFPRWYTQQLSLVIARLRWRYQGSSLALTSGLRMSSPLPWTTPTHTALDISICSPQAQQAGFDCTQTRHEAACAHCGPHFPSLLRQNISDTPIVYGRPHRDTLTVFALSQ